MGIQTIKVKTNDENPIDVDIIAENIIKISDAFEKMKNSKLSKRAIVILIRDYTNNRIGIRDIEDILDAAVHLKDHYIKK